MNFSEGQAVTWKHEMRGGYGYVRNVPAIVREISASGKRVLIEAQLERGGSRLTYVKPEKLRLRHASDCAVHRDSICDCTDQSAP